MFVSNASSFPEIDVSLTKLLNEYLVNSLSKLHFMVVEKCRVKLVLSMKNLYAYLGRITLYYLLTLSAWDQHGNTAMSWKIQLLLQCHPLQIFILPG